MHAETMPLKLIPNAGGLVVGSEEQQSHSAQMRHRGHGNSSVGPSNANNDLAFFSGDEVAGRNIHNVAIHRPPPYEEVGNNPSTVAWITPNAAPEQNPPPPAYDSVFPY